MSTHSFWSTSTVIMADILKSLDLWVAGGELVLGGTGFGRFDGFRQFRNCFSVVCHFPVGRDLFSKPHLCIYFVSTLQGANSMTGFHA